MFFPVGTRRNYGWRRNEKQKNNNVFFIVSRRIRKVYEETHEYILGSIPADAAAGSSCADRNRSAAAAAAASSVDVFGAAASSHREAGVRYPRPTRETAASIWRTPAAAAAAVVRGMSQGVEFLKSQRRRVLT